MQESQTDEMESTRQLLRAWAVKQSQDAFRALVGRYAGLVHATAKRQLGVMEHGAADVTQMVFTRLARKASTLHPDLVLPAWLHRQTVRLSLNFLRGERRRQAREFHAASMNAASKEESWQILAPHLDEAIASLPEKDRDILILRYFEDEQLHGIAAELGISREAAQKRLERAKAKLRERLSRRMGIVPALSAGVLAGRTVQAAPHGLIAKVANSSLAGFHKTGVLARWWDRATASPLAAAAGLLVGSIMGIPAGKVHLQSSSPAPPVAVVAKASTPFSPSNADKEMARHDAILTVLERLGQAPQNHRVTVEFDALMARVPAVNLPELATEAAESLSSRSRTRMMKRLLTHWTASNPSAVMEYLLTTGWPDWATGKGWATYTTWLGKDPTAASHWLTEHAGRASHFGQEHDSFSSLASHTIRSITRDNPELGLRFLLSLPNSQKSSFLSDLADDSTDERWRSDWPASQWQRLATATAIEVDAGNLIPEALRRVLQQWKAQQPEEAGEWEHHLRAGTPSFLIAKLSSPNSRDTGVTRPPTEPLEQYHSRLQDILDGRGELPLAEALTLISNNWTRGPDELKDWLLTQPPGTPVDEALTIAARRLAGNWPVAIHRRNHEKNPEGQPMQVAALQTAEAIVEPEKRERLVCGLFRRWHASDPVGASAWLPKSGWSDERISLLKTRLKLP